MRISIIATMMDNKGGNKAIKIPAATNNNPPVIITPLIYSRILAYIL